METVAGKARELIPAVAAVIAAGYLLSASILPALLALLVAAATAAASGLVLARRPSRKLEAAVVGLAAWLCLALSSATWSANRGVAGLAWLAAVLFLLPLALIPWLYAATFPSNHEPRTTNHLSS